MKNVDVLYPGWINAPNGASTFVRNLKKNKNVFCEHNINIEIYSKDVLRSKSFDDNKKIKQSNGKKSILVKLSRYSILLTYILLYLFHIRHSKAIVKSYLKKKRNPDIVYFHDIFTFYYFVKYNNSSTSLIYLTLHNNGRLWDMLHLILPKLKSCIFNKYKRTILDAIIQKSDKVGFVAKNPMDIFCFENPNFNITKAFYIYNGLPDICNHIFKYQKRPRINLISVGTLCKRKNQEGILKSLRLLDNKTQQMYHLTIVGDGEGRCVLEELAKEISTSVSFIGNTSNVDTYLRNSDIFVLLSTNEGLPISIIEAMRMGLPVIASNIAGIGEMVEDEKSGYLISPSETELSTLLYNIVHTNIDLEEMGIYSRLNFLNTFLEETMIKRYALLFMDKH